MNVSKQNQAQLLSKLQNFFNNLPDIDAAYLHGSVAKGRQHSSSDLDIALLLSPDTELNQQELLALSADISIQCGYNADIGILNHENLTYAKEVISNSILIMEKDKNRAQLFHATTLSMYADLQTARKEVINAYTA